MINVDEDHAMTYGTAGGGRITNVADNEAVDYGGVLIEGRTGRDRAGAAYDSIVGIDAEGGEESVHAAAQTTVKAVFPAKGLTGHAVKQEVPAQRPDIQLAVSQNSEDFSSGRVATARRPRAKISPWLR